MQNMLPPWAALPLDLIHGQRLLLTSAAASVSLEILSVLESIQSYASASADTLRPRPTYLLQWPHPRR